MAGGVQRRTVGMALAIHHAASTRTRPKIGAAITTRAAARHDQIGVVLEVVALLHQVAEAASREHEGATGELHQGDTLGFRQGCKSAEVSRTRKPVVGDVIARAGSTEPGAQGCVRAAAVPAEMRG
jgi:hypothetical protein